MRYEVRSYNSDGALISAIGIRATMAGARQLILDDAMVISLPTEAPWHGPSVGVLEGWFIGRTEYLIRGIY